MEVTRRRGRRRKKVLDDLKDRRGYCHLKEEVLDRTVWRNRFRGGFGPVVRQNTEWMNAVLHKRRQTNVQYTVQRSFNYIKLETYLFFRTCSDSLGSVLVSYAGGPCSISDES